MKLIMPIGSDGIMHYHSRTGVLLCCNQKTVSERHRVFDPGDCKMYGIAPLLCWVTPLKEDEPRVKPGLVRLMAMTNSFMGTLSSRSSKAVYLSRHRSHDHKTLFMA